jgi:hypothetical protein
MDVAIVSCTKGCTNAPINCTYRQLCNYATECIQFPINTADDEDSCYDIYQNALANPKISKLTYCNCKCTDRGEITMKKDEIVKFKTISGGYDENQYISDFPRSKVSGRFS